MDNAKNGVQSRFEPATTRPRHQLDDDDNNDDDDHGDDDDDDDAKEEKQ